MKIGDYNLHAIDTGQFGLDGGAMFGIVPKLIWNRTNPADEQNRITLSMRCLLLKSDERVILIDNGAGNKWNEGMKSIYKLGDWRYSLESALGRSGVTREEVTDVFLTHLHFDHAGGTTMYHDEELVLTFPNARHYIQKDHWQHAFHPTDRDRGSFVLNDFKLLRDSPQLVPLDGPGELFPGFEIIISDGHTTAMQLPKISDGRNTLLFCADLIPTTSHIPYPYIMGYDLRPLVTLNDKKEFLPRAYEEEWILFFEHDPFTAAAKLKATEKGFVMGEKVLM